jgi:hypothetical protein
MNDISQKEIETDTVILSFKESFLHVKVKEDAEFTVEKIKRDREIAKKLVGEERTPVLIDASSHFFITREGQEFAASREANENRKAVAYFTDSFGSTIKLRHFKIVNQPVVPSEVFKSREEAIEWLKLFF